MASVREIDPLLKDLNEKNQSFRRNVVSLATELKDVRSRLASREQSFVRETLTRQEVETKAKNMEEEVCRLRKSLDEKNGQLQATASTADKYLKDLDEIRIQLASTQESADARAVLAQTSQLQCLVLLKELDEKNSSLREHEIRVHKLGEQLNVLQKDLKARESSHTELKDEVLRMEQDIMQAVAKAGSSGDRELRRILDEVAAPRNFDKINKLLSAKDEEILNLKREIHILNTHWELKSKELESQLEKHRRADQELRKRVLKLEFCLQEARAQTRRLQKMGERRDKALKELRDQLATKQQAEVSGVDKQNFWESPGFKIVVTMSMLILVLFSKRMSAFLGCGLS
ncbi:nuclear envelope-associated protein 2 isoform X1 [Daucus carota subsp. sativus]|uniref:nuclear envelope-associated protein 2 isoform X1 n=1 Tax=Daucus carota subsp. sativus TaxID=79200 RepID=UPI003083805E